MVFLFTVTLLPVCIYRTCQAVNLRSPHGLPMPFVLCLYPEAINLHFDNYGIVELRKYGNTDLSNYENVYRNH